MAGFDAFISYSRRASTTLASDLQSGVERFAKPWYRLRAVRVFRDDASMSANPGLWPAIERGLTEADWFILVASPAAAASTYVGQEVTWWREHKSADRILIVLEEGVDIVWDPVAGDFDLERTDSLPPALAGAFAHEPRWIDVRWYEQPGSLGAKDPRWPERVADVAAAVRGVERDELIGENVRQHRTAQRLLRGGIATLALLLVASLVATFVAVGQRSEAQRQRTEAETQRDAAEAQARVALGRQLAAQAVSLASSDLRTASLLAVQAYRTHDDAQTRAALYRVAGQSPELVRALPVGAVPTATAVTPDGVVVVGDEDGAVTLWRDGEPSPVLDLGERVTSVGVSDDGSVVVVGGVATAVVWWNGAQAALEGTGPVAVAADGLSVASRVDDAVAVRTGQDGFVTQSYLLATLLTFTATELVGFSSTGDFLVVDRFSGEARAEGQHGLGLSTVGLALSADGSTMAGGSGRSRLLVWQGEAAWTDLVDPNATVDAAAATPDIALSASGTHLSSLVDGYLEVAPVLGGDDDTTTVPRRLLGSGDVAAYGTLAFGGDRWLVSGSGTDVLVWDLDRVARVGSAWETAVPTPCGACNAGSIAVSPEGDRVLLDAPSSVDPASVLDLTTGGVVAELFAGEGVRAWDDAGRLWQADATGVVPVDGGEPVGALALAEEDAVEALGVAGTTAVVVSDRGAVQRVDLSTGETTTVATAGQLPGAAEGTTATVSPDLTAVAVEVPQTGRVHLLDAASGAARGTVPGFAAAFDAQSRLHVFDGTTELRVDQDGRTEERAAPGVAPVPRPAVDPTGDLVVTGGRDGTDVQLLDLSRGAQVVTSFPVPQDEDRYPLSAFTADGRLVTAVPYLDGGLGSLRVLDLDPDAWVTAACAVAARDLTEAEWSRYGVGPAPDDLRCDP